MAKHPEHEEKKAATDNKKTSDNKTTNENAAPPKPRSKTTQAFLKLRPIFVYANRGSSVLAVVALIIAAIALTHSMSSQKQLDIAANKLESSNASLLVSKSELEKLKFSVAQDKVLQEDERKKQDEQLFEIIRNVTNLQIKMKVYPTLEEQLNQDSTAALVIQSAVSTPVTR